MPVIPPSPPPKPILSKVSDLLGQPAGSPTAKPVPPQAPLPQTPSKGRAEASPQPASQGPPGTQGAPRLANPNDLFAKEPGLSKGKASPSLPLSDSASQLPPVAGPGAKPAAKPSAQPAQPLAPVKGKTVAVAKGTGYYPHNSRLEGGYKDMLGKPLRTLQDFLAGKSTYVSIALDENLYEHIILSRRKKYLKTKDPELRKYLTMEPKLKYGDSFRIPELEKKYGRQIVFKAVDTGGGFEDKGFSRVDIATADKDHSREKTVNGKLTLIRQ